MDQRVRGRIVAAVISAGLAASLLANGGSVALVGDSTDPAEAVVVTTPSTSKASLSQGWQDSSTNTALYGGGLWLNPDSQPTAAVARLKAAGKTADATSLGAIASQPIATWLGDWWSTSLLKSKLAGYVRSASVGSRTPLFVTYAIPDRDCGGYSAGGYTDSAYLSWNRTIADSLRGHPAIILIEPDSIAMLGDQRCNTIVSGRLALIATVVKYYADAGIAVYLDGGNSHWATPDVMASRLTAAGIRYARGFFTNVSNFYPVNDERAYAASLSGRLGDKHYVIDVSRNGAGWMGTWCNPAGAALGENPHLTSGTTPLDAVLWVKTPGASDGTCNGGPKAGTWWDAYALALVKNRR